MSINNDQSIKLKQHFFNKTLPEASVAFSFFYENILPYDYHGYEAALDHLKLNNLSTDEVRRALTKLHELEERFFGEVLFWGEELIQGATYSLVYIGQDYAEVESILKSFGALALDPYLQFSLGNEFCKKLKATYLDTVGSYFTDWGALPEPEIIPAHWQLYLNDFSLMERGDLLDIMCLKPLSNPSFPPRHVMKWFSGNALNENTYLYDLINLYHEAGISLPDLYGVK